ncbi:hypothetical protein AVEN_244713-1 [Araneus ventricosus]|uniref:Uncharacterized protein n=1 Tax=Araneus ventricosus TaxID=182803 RepID=A0A4Y2BUD1_ARAVE|nr:hypothetical protein AVEN_244713-1 [Araneus ventricosus]
MIAAFDPFYDFIIRILYTKERERKFLFRKSEEREHDIPPQHPTAILSDENTGWSLMEALFSLKNNDCSFRSFLRLHYPDSLHQIKRRKIPDSKRVVEREHDNLPQHSTALLLDEDTD